MSAEIACPGSGSFEVSIGSIKLKAKAPKTGDYEKYKTMSLGSIEIAATGKTALAIHPVAQAWTPMNVKWISLAPVK